VTPQDPQSPMPDDRDLSGLYRATRLEEPSAELDRAVLMEARRALTRRRRRWLVPLSTAAVLVLGLSLTLYEIEAPRPTAVEAPAPPESMGEAAPASPAAGAMSDQAVERPMLKLQRSAAPRSLPEAEEALSEKAWPAERDLLTSPASGAKAESGDDPDAWVARLMELLEQGDEETLRTELAAFRQRYPDYPLPAPLEAFGGRPSP